MSRSALLVAALVSLPGLASADRRAFTRTYEYMTMPEGELELELYNTQSRATFDDDASQAFKSQVEVEYGITNRWDVSIYQVIKQSTDTPLHYAETKVRTRYRLSERGELPVDTLLYFEVVKAFGENEWELEPKVILARDFGQMTLAFNAIGAVVIAGGETELEAGWAAGATYEVMPQLKVGAETFGALAIEEGEVAVSAGPSLSWAPSSKFWAAANAGFGINDNADAFSLQMILGLHL